MSVAAARPRPTAVRPRAGSASLLLAVNGRASGVRRDPALADAVEAELQARGASVERLDTESGEEFAALLVGEERRVVVVGGDGSVHTALNAGGRRPELALVPAGGANNIARSLGVPRSPTTAARLAVEGKAREIDAIRVITDTRQHLAIEGVSVGYLALARAHYHSDNSADAAAALMAGAQALWGFHARPVAIESDGELGAVRAGQVFVANLPLYAFGLCVAPMADPGDGLLDVVVLDTRTRAGLLYLLGRLHSGVWSELPGVTHWQARALRLSTDASPVVADSTTLGPGTATFEMVPAALRVIAP